MIQDANNLPAVALGMALGVLTHLAASGLMSLHLTRRLRRRLKAGKCIRAFKVEFIEGSFTPKQYPPRSGPILYYARSGSQSASLKRSPFWYVTRRSTPVEGFKASLIAPLDNWHSDQPSWMPPLNPISDDWSGYFAALGAKMNERMEMTKMAPGKRIIFFDKYPPERTLLARDCNFLHGQGKDRGESLL